MINKVVEEIGAYEIDSFMKPYFIKPRSHTSAIKSEPPSLTACSQVECANVFHTVEFKVPYETLKIVGIGFDSYYFVVVSR